MLLLGAIAIGSTIVGCKSTYRFQLLEENGGQPVVDTYLHIMRFEYFQPAVVVKTDGEGIAIVRIGGRNLGVSAHEARPMERRNFHVTWIGHAAIRLPDKGETETAKFEGGPAWILRVDRVSEDTTTVSPTHVYPTSQVDRD